MHPILLKIAGLTIYSWGMMAVIGLIAALICALTLAKKEGVAALDILAMFGSLVFFGLVGGRLLYVLVFWKEFAGEPLRAFMLGDGGLIGYGAALFVVLSVLLYVACFRLNLFKVLDVGVPAIMLGYSIVRVGCFLNGCCYGIETTLPIGVTFPCATGARHPTQLYSSATVFIIFLILLVFRGRKKYDGEVLLLAVQLYAVYRFGIEFLRNEPRAYMWLSASQLICLVFFLAAFSIFLRNRIKGALL